jgi:hypothetical protein
MLRYRTVGQGQNDRLQTWYAEQLVPALRNSGVTGLNVGRVVAGDNPNMWISASRMDNWASMDGPGPFVEMSERQRNRLFADYNEIVQDAHNEVLRYHADLSD